MSDQIRRIVLEQSRRAHVGHIGSSLSIADIIAALYGSALQVDDPHDPERDRFILSKGHAALALYAALHLRGWIGPEEMHTFCGDASRLGVHPEQGLEGIDFATGSLGHGLSMGAGAAMAARAQGSPRRVFVLLSDAEMNEGSTWEAIMFAAHHRLSNLVAIVDLNGQQALGRSADILDLDPLAARWEAFGWNVRTVDGNRPDRVAHELAVARSGRRRPSVVLAETIFGKGVAFMEGQLRWHYMPMTEDEYRLAHEGLDCHVDDEAG